VTKRKLNLVVIYLLPKAHDLMVFQPLFVVSSTRFPPPFHIHTIIQYLAKRELKLGYRDSNPYPHNTRSIHNQQIN